MKPFYFEVSKSCKESFMTLVPSGCYEKGFGNVRKEREENVSQGGRIRVKG